jgi:hypothetical protein
MIEYMEKYPTLCRTCSREFYEYHDNKNNDIKECITSINGIDNKDIIYDIIKEHLIKRFNREEFIFL